MRDERAKELFEDVRKSREADGEGIEGWRVTEHEDWLDVKKEVKGEELDGDVGEPEQTDGGQPEDRGKIVENFRAAHPGIEIDLADVVTVGSIVPGLRLRLTFSRSNYLHLLTSFFPSLMRMRKGMVTAGKWPASPTQALMKLGLPSLYWTQLFQAGIGSRILERYWYALVEST